MTKDWTHGAPIAGASFYRWTVEPTLTLTLTQLKARLGVFVGVGRGEEYDETPWDTQTEASLSEAVASGLRKFYVPPILPGERDAYIWSFLKPIATVTLAEGESTVRMPDDFGGFEGPLTINGDSGVRVPWQIPLIGEGQVRAQYALLPDTTGRPVAASLQLLNEDDQPVLMRGQRSQLYVYPIADQDYTLQFQYYLAPNALDGTHPYAYGGTLHSETILASIKAAWERDMDDLLNGPQYQNFMQQLATSISVDRLQKPQFLGRNRDRSDCESMYPFNRHGWGVWGGITFNGV